MVRFQLAMYVPSISYVSIYIQELSREKLVGEINGRKVNICRDVETRWFQRPRVLRNSHIAITYSINSR